ncbi:MAG: SPOR domain-containing protein [Flavobacteriales bacterium]
MRLESIIVDLLYQHDYVVLPGFGGFVANYRSARLHRKSYLIHPPCKHVAFNPNLKQNDGLLATHVAASSQMDLREATEKIQHAITEFRATLASEGRLALPQLGVFFYDQDRNLQFIPDEHMNFLQSSFGLPVIQLKPIAQNLLGEESPKEPPVVDLPINPGIATWKVAAAIAIPLIAVGSWMLGARAHQPGGIDFASLNPLQAKEVKSDYLPLGLTPFSPLTIEETPITIDEELEQSARGIRYDFIKNEQSKQGIRIAKPRKKVKGKEKEERAEQTGASMKLPFAGIGGAFAEPANAERFIKDLRAKGYPAQLAGKKGNLQLVAYGMYRSEAEAARVANRIIASGGSAWIKTMQ